MTINTVIFDIGNVLIDWQPKRLVDDILPIPEKAQFFFNNVIPHEWVLNFDRGWTWEEAIKDVCIRHPDYEDIINIFLNDFDDIIVSARVGLIKPDPAIYKLAIDQFKIIPEETIFIDDRVENIDAAISLGINGYLFKNAELLHEEIEALSLI